MNAERTANICTALACATLAMMWALALSAPAHADTIKPTCWEDKAPDGTTQRHCEVNRPAAPAPHAAAPPPQAAPPPTYDYAPQQQPPQYGPPSAYYQHRGPYAPGHGYNSTLGPYGPYGYGPYGPGYGYYYDEPRPFYGPPPIVLGFGPFGFVIGGGRW